MAQIKLAEYTFDNSVGDCLPTLTPNTITMTKEDSVNGTITKRIIYIDNTTLPTRIRFGTDTSLNKSLLTVDYLDINTNITSMQEMFYGCTNLTYINTTNWNTTNVTNMYYAFGLTSISEINVTSFNTDKVTNMDYMFGNCSLLRFIDITNFTTRSNMSTGSMFANGNIKVIYDGNKWKSFMSMGITSEKVTPPEHIIAKYKYDTSITSSVTKPTITGINSSSIVTKEVTTGVDSINYVIIGYDRAEKSITNISFQNNKSLLTLDYLNFTNAITNTVRMFAGCTALTSINALNWDTSNVTSMSAMFNSCTSLASLDPSNWDVGKVTNMSDMFYACKLLTTLDLSSWKVDKVTNMSTMFNACTGLTTLNVSGWDTSGVENMSRTFTSCSKLTTLDLSNWKVDGVTSMNSMFDGCVSLTSLNISTWNTSKVTNMNSIFRNCTKLTTLNLSSWKVDIVTNMGDMFSGCAKLTTLDLTHFNVDSVTTMSGMFYNCVSLTTLKLSNWNTSKVSNMSAMFQGCAKLTTLDLSSWNTSAVSNMNRMFGGCGSLTMLDISNFDTSKVTAWGSFSANKLTNIGLVYASSSTVNSIVTNWLGTSVARNIYYMDAEPSELITQTNITYVPYNQSVLSCSEEITLRSNGDVYDELDLLTGQVIQRIGEDNEILEEEIVRTIELDGEISFYENSYIHTSSNEITPEFEFQPTLTNCYAVSDLKPNTQYTVLFEGNPTLMSLGGTTIENPISKTVIISGEVDNILWFNTSVSKIMILEGDLTNRDVEYFAGVKSSQKIEVQLRGNTPYFAKGGRK